MIEKCTNYDEESLKDTNRTTKQYLGVLYLFLSWLVSAWPCSRSSPRENKGEGKISQSESLSNDRSSRFMERQMLTHTSPSLELDLETLGVRPCLLVLDVHLKDISMRSTHLGLEHQCYPGNPSNQSGGTNKTFKTRF